MASGGGKKSINTGDSSVPRPNPVKKVISAVAKAAVQTIKNSMGKPKMRSADS
jgi:hypothetical protein